MHHLHTDLALHSIKTELEDLSLKFTKPEIYKAISLKLNETKLKEISLSTNFHSNKRIFKK